MNLTPSFNDADRNAAHEFLTELRTRITTQPIPYQNGVEARALESLWEVFGQARTAIKKFPGCVTFARKTTETLNLVLRPFTSKWHRALAEGRLNSRDGADEFRGELKSIQELLRLFAEDLHEIAYGVRHRDSLTPPALRESEITACFEPLPFGIVPTPCFPDLEAISRINASEAEEILKRRTEAGRPHNPTQDAHGLALSGGGIRSAAFCLGVVQTLAERGFLNQIDFLSTVSGGGYTGSFLSRRLGDATDPNSQTRVARPDGPDPEDIRYVRQHAEFLSPSSTWDTWGMFTATAAGMILNWAVPILLLLLASLVVSVIAPKWDETFWTWIMGSSAGLCVVGLMAYGILLKGSREALRAGASILGTTTALFAGTTLTWILHHGFHALPGWIAQNWALSGALGGLAGAVPLASRFLPAIKSPAVQAFLFKVLLALAGLIIPLLGIGLLYVFCYVGGLTPLSLHPHKSPGDPWILAGLAALAAFIAFAVVDINRTSPHRIYRNRLAKTFVYRSANDEADVPLTSLNPAGRAPYHLINTTLNVPASSNPFLRDRKCDFFLFSKHWSGAPSVGYFPTDRWRVHKAPVDLATVMAVSGAAASAHMGLASIGSVTALLTALNVRLGFWLRRPDAADLTTRPGFACLLREMTGIGMSESAAWLNLSDGGHIENTGIYELLRRRTKFIIAVDAEADPDFRFPGFMTLVRHARIDFGIRIEPNLTPLRPDSKTGFSSAHAILCRVHYPASTPDAPIRFPTATGLLLFIKLSVTGNESELIRRYKTQFPAFPHQSTADQFFNQEQFEAYRQLGAHITEGLFASALMNSHPKVTDPADMAARCQPATVRQWFRQLAESLLTTA